jgi:hypothetical protein
MTKVFRLPMLFPGRKAACLMRLAMRPNPGIGLRREGPALPVRLTDRSIRSCDHGRGLRSRPPSPPSIDVVRQGSLDFFGA